MSGMHVGIIMDGNGRWAKARGKPRWRGHVAGVDSVRDVVRSAPNLAVTTLTLYAFSSDNWKRPPTEVGRLFWLLREYCRSERAELLENGVRVSAIGRRDRIPRSALGTLEELEDATRHGTALHLRLAIDYSSRWMISQAAAQLARNVQRGALDPDEICPARMEQFINQGAPDLDLLIRTAGEQRLSDFMLWEAAYAELYYTKLLWPEFRGRDLASALAEFGRRKRSFGGLLKIEPQVKVG
ncbi:MAG: di-trans,poly-cis-decaprenylcistransferase [Gemmatimonadota bacterium]|nr:MAG: di-trans,poly-cis-decaprenylcistransferase [Gemmatimonadota bacterium]